MTKAQAETGELENRAMWLPHWAFYEGGVGDQPEIQWIIVMMYSTMDGIFGKVHH